MTMQGSLFAAPIGSVTCAIVLVAVARGESRLALPQHWQSYSGVGETLAAVAGHNAEVVDAVGVLAVAAS